MSPEPDPRLEAAVDRLLRGLRPVPAPPTLLARVMSALPAERTHAPVCGWPVWPLWLRALVLTVLGAMAGFTGWAVTAYLVQPALSRLSLVLAPLRVSVRATEVAFDALMAQLFQLPSTWLWVAAAMVGSALVLTVLLGSCCLRLCCVHLPQSATPAFKSRSR